jgi:hypothetical protein
MKIVNQWAGSGGARVSTIPLHGFGEHGMENYEVINAGKGAEMAAAARRSLPFGGAGRTNDGAGGNRNAAPLAMSNWGGTSGNIFRFRAESNVGADLAVNASMMGGSTG